MRARLAELLGSFDEGLAAPDLEDARRVLGSRVERRPVHRAARPILLGRSGS